jgi:ABC-type transport system substrate-binding protein
MIDRALAEPDRARRAALWAEIDQRIMRDAPLVPLLWEKASFSWASRVHGWAYDPWTVGPDLTAVWLDPPTPRRDVDRYGCRSCRWRQGPVDAEE